MSPLNKYTFKWMDISLQDPLSRNRLTFPIESENVNQCVRKAYAHPRFTKFSERINFQLELYLSNQDQLSREQYKENDKF